MPAYTYVRASIEDVKRLYDPTYFPSGVVINLEEVLNEKRRIYVDLRNGKFSYNPIEGFEEYVEILNNYVVGIAIDPVEAMAKLDMAVIYGDKGYGIRKGTKVVLLEAKGKGVYPLINEGEEVSKGQRVFYVVTGKYEVRVIRSPCEGILLVISELIPSELQVFRAVLVSKHDVIGLERV